MNPPNDKYKAGIIFCALFLLTAPAFAQTTWYIDADKDGWGNPLVSQTAASKPAGYVQNNLDCNDNNVHNTTWSTVGSAGFSPSGVYSTSITTDAAGTPYIAYTDYASTGKANVMKYNGGTWALVGAPAFSAPATSLAIAIHGSTPYVAYSDFSVGDKATVMKYDGSAWVTVGTPGFSSGSVHSSTAIAVDGNGTPYVAYTDWDNNDRVTVKKYDGSSWVNVGGAAISASQAAGKPEIVIHNGAIYVGFADGATSPKATVMKYDGVSWTALGSPQFSPGEATFLKMAVSSNGVPFIAYEDPGQLSKITVMKYDGTGWVVLGKQGFSSMPSLLDQFSITTDAGDTVYVAYMDSDHSGKITVAKFNGTAWVPHIYAGISAGQIRRTSMTTDKYGILYAAYGDNAVGDKASVQKIDLVRLGNPTQPSVTPSANPIVSGTPVTIQIQPGAMLNDAMEWKWYSQSCGGTPEGTGTSITVSPTTLTAYFARGEGHCLTTPGNCGSVPIIIIPVGISLVDGTSSGLSLSPNPGSGTFIVKGTLNTTAGEAKLEVVNAFGQVVYSSTIAVENGLVNTKLEMATQPAGMYILKLVENGKIQNTRFVKE